MQRVEDFLDEDELEERRTHTVRARADFDTFGARAAGEIRAAAEADAKVHGVIPGPVPDILLAPAREGIGDLGLGGVRLSEPA